MIGSLIFEIWRGLLAILTLIGVAAIILLLIILIIVLIRWIISMLK